MAAGVGELLEFAPLLHHLNGALGDASIATHVDAGDAGGPVASTEGGRNGERRFRWTVSREAGKMGKIQVVVPMRKGRTFCRARALGSASTAIQHTRSSKSCQRYVLGLSEHRRRQGGVAHLCLRGGGGKRAGSEHGRRHEPPRTCVLGCGLGKKRKATQEGAGVKLWRSHDVSGVFCFQRRRTCHVI